MVREDKGSTVQLIFQNATDLQHAAVAVQSIHKSFTQGRFVYLGRKKEKSEMRARNIVIRIGVSLEELETKKEEPAKVGVFRNGKFVKVGGNRVGYTYKGEWK